MMGLFLFLDRVLLGLGNVMLTVENYIFAKKISFIADFLFLT